MVARSNKTSGKNSGSNIIYFENYRYQKVDLSCLDEVPSVREILLVEDNDEDAEDFISMIELAPEEGYNLTRVSSIPSALTELAKKDYMVTVVSLNLTSGGGEEGIVQIKINYPDVPIVIISDQSEAYIEKETIKLGAQDFLLKDELSPNLCMRVLLYAHQRHVMDEQLISVLGDVSRYSEQLEFDAKHDSLTRLPNRMSLYSGITRALSSAHRNGNIASLMLIDLEKFERVNEIFGYKIGDQVLKCVADRLRNVLRKSDTVARMVGDKFAVLLENLDSNLNAYTVADTIYSTLSGGMIVDDKEFNINCKIGISNSCDAESCEELVEKAELALKYVKSRGDDYLYFYSETLNNTLRRRRLIERKLLDVKDFDEFQCFYQPVYDISKYSVQDNDKEVDTLEIFLRWENAELGEVHPNEFFPIVERMSLANKFIEYALFGAKIALEKSLANNIVVNQISINVGARQVCDAGFVTFFLSAIDEISLDIKHLCLDICERDPVRNQYQYEKNIASLKQAGLRIALDDYGSGLSSLARLKDLPLDILKLDRSLIKDIHVCRENMAITAGAIEIAHRLDKKIVAEGVEKNEEYEVLKDLKCDFIQGYLFARPMALDEFLDNNK